MATKRGPAPGSAAWQKQVQAGFRALHDIDHRYATALRRLVRSSSLELQSAEAEERGEPPITSTNDRRYWPMEPDDVALLIAEGHTDLPSWYKPIIAFCTKYPDTDEAHDLAAEFNAFQKEMQNPLAWVLARGPFGL